MCIWLTFTSYLIICISRCEMLLLLIDCWWYFDIRVLNSSSSIIVHDIRNNCTSTCLYHNIVSISTNWDRQVTKKSGWILPIYSVLNQTTEVGFKMSRKGKQKNIENSTRSKSCRKTLLEGSFTRIAKHVQSHKLF